MSLSIITTEQNRQSITINQNTNNGQSIVDETLMSLDTNTTPDLPRRSLALSENIADITDEIEQSKNLYHYQIIDNLFCYRYEYFGS